MSTTPHLTKEIVEIANSAKETLSVTPDLKIHNAKTFKLMTKRSEDNAGSYNYIQDRVFINKDVAQLLPPPHLEWMIFHEFGHARLARSFAHDHFYPAITYANYIQDNVISNGVGNIWNGLCDCFVNELVLQKKGLKKCDQTLENSIDGIEGKFAMAMSFHLYDYWRHGWENKRAQEAKTKIPTEILNFLKNKLPLTSLDNPFREAFDSLSFVVKMVFPLRISIQSMSKKMFEANISRTKLPEFWGNDDSQLSLILFT